MPAYTFYPCQANGLADTFISHDLEDDERARLHALYVLDQHASASHVVVWDGQRKVHTRQRMHPDLAAVLSRPRST